MDDLLITEPPNKCKYLRYVHQDKELGSIFEVDFVNQHMHL